MGHVTKSLGDKRYRHLSRAEILFGVGVLGAVVLYGVTSWLWLVVRQALH